MARLVHSSEMSTVEFSTPDSVQSGSGNDVVLKSPGSKPGSERILEREARVLNDLGGVIGPELFSVAQDGQLNMSRMGTHDLSDMMHDMRMEDVEAVVSELIHQVHGLHELGYVSRDIKPGNVMLNVNHMRITGVAGLIDFGMSLRINRKQDEKGVIGGTEPYSHPSQTALEHREHRAHPGQDWYAVGRTIVHILVGGQASALTAFIQTCTESDINEVISLLQQSWSTEVPQSLRELISVSVDPSGGTIEALDRLQQLGVECAGSIPRTKRSPAGQSQLGFQRNASARPRRHDLLIIIDSTGSMASQIEDLKVAFRDVAGDLSDKIDLRIDLWSMGDYGRTDSDSSSIILLGERMRGDTFRDSVSRIDANREQHDEAEAYEVALQAAYLQRGGWHPRKNTVRTIVLIGDAYAHGWLDANYWGSVFGDAYGRPESTFEGRHYPATSPNPALQKEFEDFQRRHEIYITREKREAELAAFKKAKQTVGKDDYGGRGHIKVKGEVYADRPNFKKAVSKCVSDKQARIHTIATGDNLVNHSFMKYVAMKGKGTYTHIKEGELKIALSGILAIADPNVFRELKDRVQEINPTTQALNSQTTFVLDSEGDENF